MDMETRPNSSLLVPQWVDGPETIHDRRYLRVQDPLDQRARIIRALEVPTVAHVEPDDKPLERMMYAIWEGLSPEDRDYFDSLYEHRNQFCMLTGLHFDSRLENFEDVFEPQTFNGHMESAIILINHIRHLQDEAGLEQLVFLDRSARLGAHMLRRVWDNLQARGEIDPSMKLPKSTFINVGRSNSRDDDFEQIVRFFGDAFTEATDAKTILVVDDYSSTGGSIRTAMDMYAQAGRMVFGTAQFNELTPWYSNRSYGLKGVDELDETRFTLGKLPDYVRNLDDTTARMLAARTQHVSQDEFVEHLFTSGEIIDVELGLHTSISLEEVGELYLWAKSLGGLQTLPYGADTQSYTLDQVHAKQRSHTRYRQLINTCVDGYFTLRDEQIAQMNESALV